jgi:hypothetical protein
MRPSWQIDLKWMLGLAACALIVVSGVLYSLSLVTSRDTAIPLASALVSAGISDRVSDAEYAQVQAATVGSPTSNVSLSPVALSFPGSEIAGLDKQAAASVVGGKLASVMYDNGEAAAKSLIVTPAPESGQEPVKLGPVGAFTASNHTLFTQLFLATVTLALFALGGVAMMARGWGRLGAPAFIVAVGSAPLAVLGVVAKGAAGSGDPGEGVFAANARAAFDGAAGDLSTIFLAVTAAAIISGVLCVLGSALSLAVSKAAPVAEKPVIEATPEPAPGPAAQTVSAGPLRASASIAATTYRASGTPQVAGKPEGSLAATTYRASGTPQIAPKPGVSVSNQEVA